MSISDWNIDASSNKFLNTYIKGYVDVSGGDVILRNGKIRSEANTIEFDDTYAFTNFLNNVNIYGQQKLTYNSIDYDVGERISKIQDIYDNKIGPMFYNSTYDFNEFNNIYCSGQIQYEDSNGNHIDLVPIVLSNESGLSTANSNISALQTRTTNMSYNPTGILTTFASNVTFSTAPTMSGANISVGTIPANRVSGGAVTLTTANQAISSVKIFSAVNQFTANIRIDQGIILNNNTLTIPNTTLQKLQFISTATSDLQTQITNISTNSISLSASNIFTGTTNQFTNTLRLDGSLNLNANALIIQNSTLQKLQYISTISSDIQTQSTTNATNITTLNTKNTDISYASSITTIANTLASSTLTFSTSINGATKLVFDNIMLYCNSLSGNVQSAVTTANTNITTNTNSINSINTKLTDISYASSITTIANTLASSTFTFSASINGTTKAVFDNILLYCNSLTGNVQTALTNLSYSVNPVGTIIMSPLSDIQTTSSNKYLLCNGASVGRSSYPNLFAKIGTSFGSTDTFSFNVPNYQGAFLRGYGQAMVNGQIYEGNFTVNQPQQDAIQEHRHWGQTGSYCGSNRASGVTNAFASGGYYPQTYNFDQTGLQSDGRSDSGETRPMNYSVFYYIKS